MRDRKDRERDMITMHNIIAVAAIVLSQRQGAGQELNSRDVPITILGRSNRSLRIEKQKVEGTGAPDGFSRTQCEYTDCVVFSNA